MSAITRYAFLALLPFFYCSTAAEAAQYFSPTSFVQKDGQNVKGVWYDNRIQACDGPWIQVFRYFTPKQIKSRSDNVPCGNGTQVTTTVIESDTPPAPYR